MPEFNQNERKAMSMNYGNKTALLVSPRQLVGELQQLADANGYTGIYYDVRRRVFYGVTEARTAPLLRRPISDDPVYRAAMSGMDEIERGLR